MRQHVAAKRYLCTVDTEYQQQLSEPSLVSLRLQGGQMSPAELAAFRSPPNWEDALRLRKWDDLAKIANLATPSLAHFLPMLDKLVVSASEAPLQAD